LIFGYVIDFEESLDEIEVSNQDRPEVKVVLVFIGEILSLFNLLDVVNQIFGIGCDILHGRLEVYQKVLQIVNLSQYLFKICSDRQLHQFPQA